MKFIRMILKMVIPASQVKQYMYITNINHFLLFREIVTVQSESYVLHIYIYCGQNEEIFNTEEGGM